MRTRRQGLIALVAPILALFAGVSVQAFTGSRAHSYLATRWHRRPTRSRRSRGSTFSRTRKTWLRGARVRLSGVATIWQ
jgi:hypothetical protein